MSAKATGFVWGVAVGVGLTYMYMNSRSATTAAR